MSVIIDGKVATLSNYLELTKNYSRDIQDEVRSAIMDDTPISPYIKKCKGDNFKLNQIRLAIREYVPSRYISSHLSATNLKWVRRIHESGYSLKVLDKYLSKGGVLSISCDTLDLLLSAYFDGVNIDSVDFNTVSEELSGLVCSGLKRGYPMWIITESSIPMSKEFMHTLMKCMNLSLDVHPFLGEGWDVERVQMILSKATKMEYTVLMKHINSRFSKNQLEEILKLATQYLDFLPLCLKDDEGMPVFNEYQMGVLAEIIEYTFKAEQSGRVGIDVEEFLKPSMSDVDMRKLFYQKVAELKAEEGRVLSGRLPKKC